MSEVIKTYSELIQFGTFKDRFNYLKQCGVVGESTFGFERYLNQVFYTSKEWRKVRDDVIIRDNGCDIGMEDYPISGRIIVHHLNPITIDDIIERRDWILDPEYLISVSHLTHNAITYGDESILITIPKDRTPNDTCPWKL